jgi:LysM repeat protein
MRTIKVSEGQTLLDIAIEHCGDVNVWNAIADLNALSLTDDLVVGQELKLPDAAIEKERIVEMFRKPHLKPASAEEPESEGGLLDEGLEFWYIEDDFVIS